MWTRLKCWIRPPVQSLYIYPLPAVKFIYIWLTYTVEPHFIKIFETWKIILGYWNVSILEINWKRSELYFLCSIIDCHVYSFLRMTTVWYLIRCSILFIIIKCFMHYFQMEGKPIRSRFQSNTRASVRVSQYLESWGIDKPFSNLQVSNMATKLLSVTVGMILKVQNFCCHGNIYFCSIATNFFNYEFD